MAKPRGQVEAVAEPVAPRPEGTVEGMAAVKVSLATVAEECCRSPLAHDEAVPVSDEALAAMAKALGHPARLRIVRLLAEHPSCVTGDLVAELPLAQSTVSEHLRILRQAGLVQGEIEGPKTFYCVNWAGLAAFKGAIAGL